MRMVVRKWLWGEERITIEFPDGTHRSVPISWTDAAAADPYLRVGGGRSLFRIEDLLELVQLVGATKQ